MSKLRNIFFFVVLFALATPVAAQQHILRGRVVFIADGDTITVQDDNKRQYSIRFAGIDAPESSQPFGNTSSENLAKLVFSKFVNVEWYKHDHYGRIVGNVFVDAQDAGLQQIKAGLAWHYKYYENEQSISDRLAYAEAEVKAREKRLGLWADAAPTPPWSYRHGGTSSPARERVVPNTPRPVVANAPEQTRRVYIRGPRGGCYYLDSSRHKIYGDHNLCN
jgi:endonuclease YncB( thermonuclease family)